METEPSQSKQNEGGGKAVVSIMGLVALLVALVFIAPKLNALFNFKEETAPGVQEEEVVQASGEYSDWLTLVEEQLPKDEKSSYRVIQLRLSDDRRKLLIDLEITSDEEKERVDFILERDEFGRYISENDAIPMKLYLPKSKQPAIEETGEDVASGKD